MNRAELHLHTKLSDDISIIGAEEIIIKAEQFGISSLGITNLNNLQDFDEISKYAKGTSLKIIYGAELICPKGKITIIAKNNDGIKELYRVVSSLEKGVIDLSVLKENRKNLLIGSAGNDGELFGKINTENEDVLEKIAAFYDYFEIYPAKTQSDKETNKKIYALGEELGVPTIAVSNAHYLSKNDSVCRDIVRAEGESTEEDDGNLYLRSTEQLLREFSYLGDKAAKDAVINNTKLIADLTEPVTPLKAETYFVKLDNDYSTIEEICINKANEIYGRPLPQMVEYRLQTELDFIRKNDFASIYLIAYKMAKNLKDNSHIYSVRGTAGSAFVAFLLGVSDINPLPSHYHCSECRYFEKTKDTQNPFDLPDKNCPVCDTLLKADGFNIPYESFMGFSGNKLPDFDINISESVRLDIIDYMKQLFGSDKIALAGTVSRLLRYQIDKKLQAYEEKTGISFTAEQKEQIAEKLCGVKNEEGVHPCGIMAIPWDMEFEDFTPLRKNVASLDATHFDFHSLHHIILKLDILEPAIISLLETLKNKTGVYPSKTDINTAEIFELIKSGDTLCIPEFDYDFIKDLIRKTQPKNIAELVKLCGFAHGTSIWRENGEYLIEKGIPLSRIPTLREDIMNDLISVGVSKTEAFQIMEAARKGLFSAGKVSDQTVTRYKKLCKPLGDWYFDYISRARYIFPKAHALFYVTTSLRCAWFKIHYPKEFYTAYLECFFEDRKALTEEETEKYNEIKKRL